MLAFSDYLRALLSNWWLFMGGSGPYAVQTALRRLWPGYDARVDRYVGAQTRRRISIWVAFFGVFVAGFLAFSDERAEVQRVQAQLQQVRDQFSTTKDMLAGKQSQRIRVSHKLANFESQATDLLFVHITKEEYPIWKQKQEKFAKDVTSWVSENLGLEAKARLLDTSVFTMGVTTQPVDPDQRDRLFWLDKISHNILSIMQDEAMSGTLPSQQELPR